MNTIKKFSKIKINEIKTKYLVDKKSLSWLAKNNLVSKDVILRIFRENGIISRTQSEQCIFDRKYTWDENFLNDLDSWEKMYFLGILYADGYNDEKKGVVALKLQEKDRDILERLAKILIKNGKVKLYEYEDVKTGKKDVSLRISSRKLSKRLVELGCFQKKSFLLKFPLNLVKNKFFNAFILGYFDGDGCANISLIRKRWKVLTVTFVGSKYFSKGMLEFLKTLDIRAHISKMMGCYRVYFSSQEDCRRIYDFMYAYSKMCLKRKQQKFLDYFTYSK